MNTKRFPPQPPKIYNTQEKQSYERLKKILCEVGGGGEGGTWRGEAGG